MASATLTGKQRANIVGHQRVVTYTSIVFAGVGDTWKVNAMKTVLEISLTPTTGINAAFTVAGNTITCVAAGTYRGSVYGL